jgi:hypothetical protein
VLAQGASPEEAPENSPEASWEDAVDDGEISAVAASAAISETQEPAASSSSTTAPAARELSSLEAAQSVEAAVKAKEELVKLSLLKAKEDVAAKRRELEERRLREERELEAQERELIRLHQQASTDGVDTARVQRLRNEIESAGREMRYLERDVASKLCAMQKATEAYITAQESLTQKREARKRLEEEMLELMLSAGKARDQTLNQVLEKI